MATIQLRVRFVGGDHIDVSFEGPDRITEEQVTDHVVSTLAQDGGVIRTQHDGRLVVLFGRGIAAIEFSPRGAVL